MKTNLHLLLGLLLLTPAIACKQKQAKAEDTQTAAKSQIAQAVDRPGDPVRAEIADGRVRLIAKEDLGWPEDVPCFVEGLSGRCVGLFTGDIGQDTNPFLCMLMDDGGVEILSYQSLGHPIYKYNLCFTSSGRLPGMKDIVSFREGPVINEFGFAEYHSIFAIDREGREHEIEPCVRPGRPLYHNADNAEASRLCIYPNWILVFTVGIVESENLYNYTGRLRPIKMDYENNVYEYSYTMLTRYDYPPVGDEEALRNTKPIPTNESGTFRLTLRNDGEDYDLTVLSGPLSFATESGSPAHYTPVRGDEDPGPVTD